MHHLARAAAAVLACAALSACSPDHDGRDHVEPIDSFDNVHLRGVYDCSERPDQGYSNGNGFTITVVTVDGRPVEVNTANAYLAMQAAADAQGVQIRINSGFRTMAEQEYFWGCYQNCNCNSCNLAAQPGYSNHQSGHALDLNTGSGAGVLNWLNQHGASFGFARTVPSEPWHWEWWGDASDFDGPCGGPQIPAGCRSGSFDGAFCDDDGLASEESHDCLAEDLGVNFTCGDIEGHPAACGADAATRGAIVQALGDAYGMPLTGHPDGFGDDTGHPLEAHMNAAKVYGIYLGYNGGTEGRVDAVASRSTIASVIDRMVALPPATQDWFSDDNGSENEGAHNRIAEHAGFTFGCGADASGGRRFCGDQPADRTAIARFACGLMSRDTLVPVWDRSEEPELPVDPGEDPGEDPDEPKENEPVPGAGDPDGFDPDPELGAQMEPSVEPACAQVDVPAFAALAIALVGLRRRRR